jgi:hypothetical protein
MGDTPRRPDIPPPPQPKPPNPGTNAEWRNRNESTMIRPQDKTADPRQRGSDQQQGPRQQGPADSGQQRTVRPDAGTRPVERGRLSTDHREWKAELRTVHDTKDVNQYRREGDRSVDMQQLRADFTGVVKQAAAERRASGGHGGTLIDVGLKNAGSKSELAAVRKNLVDVGRQDGVLVRVTVLPPDRKPPPVDVPDGPPGGRTPGVRGPRPPDKSVPVKPGQDSPVKPGQVPPPVRPVPPHVHQPPPDIHRR